MVSRARPASCSSQPVHASAVTAHDPRSVEQCQTARESLGSGSGVPGLIIHKSQRAPDLTCCSSQTRHAWLCSWLFVQVRTCNAQARLRGGQPGTPSLLPLHVHVQSSAGHTSADGQADCAAQGYLDCRLGSLCASRARLSSRSDCLTAAFSGLQSQPAAGAGVTATHATQWSTSVCTTAHATESHPGCPARCPGAVSTSDWAEVTLKHVSALQGAVNAAGIACEAPTGATAAGAPQCLIPEPSPWTPSPRP